MTPSPVGPRPRAEAVIDLDAISDNVEALQACSDGRDVMAVVKADGYGHGAVMSGQAARRGGASWLGVALLDEALELRAAGDTGRVLSWLAVPGERYADAITADVDVAAYSIAQLDEISAAARVVGARARVQLKVDTGLSRGGAHLDDWAQLIEAAAARQAANLVEITGVWSHLACSDEPDHPSVRTQLAAFDGALADARAASLEPEHVHLANSGGVLNVPASWHTMIRPGIAVYGVSPMADGSSPITLRPAMTLESTVALVKQAHPGAGVSYGHTYTVNAETTLALVPLGYGDGIPRHASSAGPVQIGDRRVSVAGRVCMDQFVVDLGAPDVRDVRAGDRVVLFGDPATGVPSAHDWAAASGTIGYEIVTRIGARVPRRYSGVSA